MALAEFGQIGQRIDRKGWLNVGRRKIAESITLFRLLAILTTLKCFEPGI